MSILIKYKCDLCKTVCEIEEIQISYTKELHLRELQNANGHFNGNVHICKKCASVLKSAKFN